MVKVSKTFIMFLISNLVAYPDTSKGENNKKGGKNIEIEKELEKKHGKYYGDINNTEPFVISGVSPAINKSVGKFDFKRSAKGESEDENKAKNEGEGKKEGESGDESNAERKGIKKSEKKGKGESVRTEQNRSSSDADFWIDGARVNIGGVEGVCLYKVGVIPQKDKNINSKGDKCVQVTKEGKESNVYEINIGGRLHFVWCDTTTQGGGWIIIQNRFEGVLNFNRNWTDYKFGFGLPKTEFWYGLEEVHSLTLSQPYELLIVLRDFDKNEVYAKYTDFAIGPEKKGYPLERLGAYNGTAGDSLSDHVGVAFSTKDKDNDGESSINCAESSGGGWWYRNITCCKSNLNGMYNEKNNTKSMTWATLRFRTPLKEIKMMIRPRPPVPELPTTSGDGESGGVNETVSDGPIVSGSVEKSEGEGGEIENEDGDKISDGIIGKCLDQNDIMQKDDTSRNISSKDDRCAQVTREGKESNVYEINIGGRPHFVWCDTTTQGGGWIIIQNRFEGVLNFNRNWTDYKFGFGLPKTEFWYGLEEVHSLTLSQPYELLIVLRDFDKNEVYAKYTDFAIGPEKKGYPLERLGAYNGTAGDSLSDHVGVAFSTKDKDNDGESSINCAESSGGGWWYRNITCCKSNLNGMYNEKNNTKSMTWATLRFRTPLKEIKMMIRPRPPVPELPTTSGDGESGGVNETVSDGPIVSGSVEKSEGEGGEIENEDGDKISDGIIGKCLDQNDIMQKDDTSRNISSKDDRCAQVTREGKESNVYEINIGGRPHFVWCDTTTQGGGWIIIQNRFEGVLNFNRNWTDYKFGFGLPKTEFWYGLEEVHSLTLSQPYELLIVLRDFDKNEVYAKYTDFAIGPEKKGYPLERLGAYNGTAGDSLSDHVGVAFSTKDKDNDGESSINCAESSGGGWWYRNITCCKSNLNGMYNEKNNTKSMTWATLRFRTPLKEIKMMIRPRPPVPELPTTSGDEESGGVNETVSDGPIVSGSVEKSEGEGGEIENEDGDKISDGIIGKCLDQNDIMQKDDASRDISSKDDRCAQVTREGKESNVYEINIGGRPHFVWCDTTTQGGGWIIIQNRFEGVLNFNRNWTDYKFGFGLPKTEFWYGLEEVHSLTLSQPYELLIVLRDFDNNEVYAKYADFAIGSEKKGYTLERLGIYNGTAGDSLSDHVGAAFSTKDKDNDGESSINCAESSGGGWWYKNITCYKSNLNGMYNEKDNTKSVSWGTFHFRASLKEVKIMIRASSGDLARVGGQNNRDCRLATREGKTSDIFQISVPGSPKYQMVVWCDTTTQGGGWIVIQRRFNGKLNFNENWINYKMGFGNLYKEFWFGLEKIYYLLSLHRYELLIALKDFDNKKVFAKYDNFLIGTEDEGYPLKVLGVYNGAVGDSLSDHVGAAFSTRDRDSDGESSIDCSQSCGGGWWYKNITCYKSNLNGMYNARNNKKSVTWNTFHSQTSLKEVEIMIRPIFDVADKTFEPTPSKDIAASMHRHALSLRPNSTKDVRNANPSGIKKEAIRDCLTVTRNGNEGDIFEIDVLGAPSCRLVVWCNTEKHGGGWIVIQRRIDGTVSFNEDWNSYKNGIGNIYEEFWFGLENIHYMTSKHRYELLITLKDFENKEAFATYDDFEIGTEEEGYPLKRLGIYNGTAGDSLSDNVGAVFSTRDRDSGSELSINCAESSGGAWWFKNPTCCKSNLNGMYNERDNKKSVTWNTFHHQTSLKEVEMMIRPIFDEAGTTFAGTSSEDIVASMHRNALLLVPNITS